MVLNPGMVIIQAGKITGQKDSMKRMEQMKVYCDLFWAAWQSKGFDNLFRSADFTDKFAQFHKSEFYNKWIKTEEYQKYVKWQDS